MEKNFYTQRGGDFGEFLQRICKEHNLPFSNEEQAMKLLKENKIDFQFEA